MQGHNPMRARKLRGDRMDGLRLLRGHEPECVGERKMRLRRGVEHDDTEAIVGIGRQHHRKSLGPNLRQPDRKP